MRTTRRTPQGRLRQSAGATPGVGKGESRPNGAKPGGRGIVQKTSNTPAAPMPPPMHIVTTTFFAPRRLPSINA